MCDGHYVSGPALVPETPVLSPPPLPQISQHYSFHSETVFIKVPQACPLLLFLVPMSDDVAQGLVVNVACQIHGR